MCNPPLPLSLCGYNFYHVELQKRAEVPQVTVAGYARTAFGRFGGAFRDVSALDLGAGAARAALTASGIGPQEIGEVAFGANFPGADRSIARQVALRAGVPDGRPAFTVDQACCSSLAAVALACRGITAGENDFALAGGTENLSAVPYFLTSMRWGSKLGPVVLADQLVISCPHTGVPRAVQAGQEALSHGIDRLAQDEWAVRSQELYEAARARGDFGHEITATEFTDSAGRPALLTADEAPRPGTTLAALAELPTVYGSPTVTAGTAPNLSSGATALVLASQSAIIQKGLAPKAVLSGWTMLAGEPAKIASIPAVAAQRALARTGLTLDDLDLIEINEAFAAVPLVTTLVLAGGDAELAGRLREKTNVNGGSIAIGHPTGATAARLIMTAIGELTRRGGGTGLVTLCGGIGEAAAIIVRVD
jgi:acetyl-CoA C-acetyltransferase